LVLDPAGAFAFVNGRSSIAERYDCSVRLTIDPNTGHLDAAEWWYYNLPGKLQLDPARRFLFETWGAYDGTFSSIKIDSKTGQPQGFVETNLGSFPCHTWNWTIERAGKFAFFVCSDSAQVLSYKIDAKSVVQDLRCVSDLRERGAGWRSGRGTALLPLAAPTLDARSNISIGINNRVLAHLAQLLFLQ
jgi:hypothetical protein